MRGIVGRLAVAALIVALLGRKRRNPSGGYGECVELVDSKTPGAYSAGDGLFQRVVPCPPDIYNIEVE